MKFLYVAISVAVLLIATSSHALETIDLDVPGNLASMNVITSINLRKFNVSWPKYADDPVQSIPGCAPSFRARNIEYTDLIMATNPAKKRLKFTLGDTAYVKVIALEGYSAP